MVSPAKMDDAQIRERVARELAHWTYAGGALRRTYRTYGWKGALMAVNAIGHLAEAAWHHPDLAVSYDRVDVALSSHDAGGVTDRDFALAAQIESVVCWRPARSGSPLSGTPQNEQHGYIRYDD